jgi:hypothetical protein
LDDLQGQLRFRILTTTSIGSLALKLTPEDLKEICDAVAINEVAGEREMALLAQYSWKVANTSSI